MDKWTILHLFRILIPFPISLVFLFHFFDSLYRSAKLTNYFYLLYARQNKSPRFVLRYCFRRNSVMFVASFNSYVKLLPFLSKMTKLSNMYYEQILCYCNIDNTSQYRAKLLVTLQSVCAILLLFSL